MVQFILMEFIFSFLHLQLFFQQHIVKVDVAMALLVLLFELQVADLQFPDFEPELERLVWHFT